MRRRGRKPRRVSTRKWRRDYIAYLNSVRWRELRELVLDRDKGRCLGCGGTYILHVHHLHYRTFRRETGSELITLCEKCHDKEHELWKKSKQDRRMRTMYWKKRLGVIEKVGQEK